MAKPEPAFHLAIQRFGLGARPDSRDRLGSEIRARLLEEIQPERALIRGEGLPNTARGIQIVTQIEDQRRIARQTQRQQVATTAGGDMASGQGLASGQNMAAPDTAPSRANPRQAGMPQGQPPRRRTPMPCGCVTS